MSLVVAPNVGTYSTRTLYVTPAEFLAAPTGVDINQLIPGGNQAQNQQALVMQLQRASAYADNYCYGARGCIAATVDTQAASYRVVNDPALGAVIKATLDYTPILAVSAVSIGSTPAALAPLTDLSNVWISRKTATIPISGTNSGPPQPGRGGHVFATIQYVNGWANTALTAAAVPGSTSLTVASTLGIMPGQQINVQNANNAETVTVALSFTPSNTAINAAVPITTPLVGTYAPKDTVTAFPQDIKQAVILIAKALIKTRGSESITIATTSSQPDHIDKLESGVSSDIDIAMELLSPYKRGI